MRTDALPRMSLNPSAPLHRHPAPTSSGYDAARQMYLNGCDDCRSRTACAKHQVLIETAYVERGLTCSVCDAHRPKLTLRRRTHRKPVMSRSCRLIRGRSKAGRTRRQLILAA